MFRAPSERAVPGLGARLAQGGRAAVTVAGLHTPHADPIPGEPDSLSKQELDPGRSALSGSSSLEA